MSQNSGPFLVSSYSHPGFNPRAAAPAPPSVPSPGVAGGAPKRISNGMMVPPNPGSPAMPMNASPSPMRPGQAMGPMKPAGPPLGPMDKSNTMPYPSRYGRKVWPVTRSVNGETNRSLALFSTFFSPLQRKTSADTTITRRRTFGRECPDTSVHRRR